MYRTLSSRETGSTFACCASCQWSHITHHVSSSHLLVLIVIIVEAGQVLNQESDAAILWQWRLTSWDLLCSLWKGAVQQKKDRDGGRRASTFSGDAGIPSNAIYATAGLCFCLMTIHLYLCTILLFWYFSCPICSCLCLSIVGLLCVANLIHSSTWCPISHSLISKQLSSSDELVLQVQEFCSTPDLYYYITNKQALYQSCLSHWFSLLRQRQDWYTQPWKSMTQVLINS